MSRSVFVERELWDVCDGTRSPVGRTHPRGVAMKPGDFHVAVGIWTLGFGGKILLTLRAGDKSSYPNLWENTGGCALAGETSKEAAIRELREETGIRCRADDLTLIGAAREESVFIDTYLLIRDVPLRDIVLQRGETQDARWVAPDALDALIVRGAVAAPVVRRYRSVRARLLEEAARLSEIKGDSGGAPREKLS